MLKNNVLVISMKDARGRRRRNGINFEYTKWIYGVNGKTVRGDLLDKMRNMPGASERVRMGKLGCFAAHVKCLKYIVKNNLINTIVCEDDVRHVRRIPRLDSFPRDGMCMLGGEMRQPVQDPWYEEANFQRKKKRILRGLKKGVNAIDYDKYSINGSEAIFYPNADVAKQILEEISRSTSLTHFDLWLRKNKLMKYIYFPNPFGHGADAADGTMVPDKRPPRDCWQTDVFPLINSPFCKPFADLRVFWRVIRGAV